MPTKEETARSLAGRHYEVEAGLTHVYRIVGADDVEARPSEPIKLLEVNEFTVPAGIMPIRFGPAPAVGLDFPSVILEITPEEFLKIQSRELELPDGWTIGELIPRAAGAG